jgi:uncharacterized protein (DUF302 family)
MSGAEAVLGIKVRLEASFETAEQRTIDALRAEGFGVLTEIDVRETLRQKLGVDFRPYKILGACNPPLAHRALTIAPDVGLMLPCNVTLSYVEDGITEVAIVDPLSMLGVVHVPALESIAEEARSRLFRVAAALQQG